MKPKGILLEADDRLRAAERAWDASRRDETAYNNLIAAVKRTGNQFKWWADKLRRNPRDNQVRGIFKNVAYEEGEAIYSIDVVQHTRVTTREEYESGQLGSIERSERVAGEDHATLEEVLEIMADYEIEPSRRYEGVPQWDSEEGEATYLDDEVEHQQYSFTVGYSRRTPLGAGTYNTIDLEDWERFNTSIQRGQMDDDELPDFDWRTGRMGRWR
jgi:hypothetical protein